MTASIITERRIDRSTGIDDVRAPGMKRTSRRLIGRVRHRSGNTVKRFPFLCAARERCQETLRVRMLGLMEDLIGMTLLRDDACIHHINPIGDVGYDSQVMGNIEEGQVSFLLSARGRVRGSGPGSSRRGPSSARRQSRDRDCKRGPWQSSRAASGRR